MLIDEVVSFVSESRVIGRFFYKEHTHYTREGDAYERKVRRAEERLKIQA